MIETATIIIAITLCSLILARHKEKQTENKKIPFDVGIKYSEDMQDKRLKEYKEVSKL